MMALSEKSKNPLPYPMIGGLGLDLRGEKWEEMRVWEGIGGVEGEKTDIFMVGQVAGGI